MFVKICGITNAQDAQVALDYGADALGFVFYKHSKRYITPQRAREIAPSGEYLRVGVFAGMLEECSSKSVEEIFREAALNYAQLHSESFYNATFKPLCNVPTLRVIRAKSKEQLHDFFTQVLKDDKEKQKIGEKVDLSHYVLVDSFVESFGGEGVETSLEWFSGLPTSRIILAGGVDAKILPSIAKMGFFGVDVSSSVESSKGVKDKEKLKEFLQYAKSL